MLNIDGTALAYYIVKVVFKQIIPGRINRRVFSVFPVPDCTLVSPASHGEV